jgi:hypothetical protein
LRVAPTTFFNTHVKNNATNKKKIRNKMSYLINECVTLNYLQDLDSPQELITMLHLLSQASEEGTKKVQTQKTHIARLCMCKSEDKSYLNKYVNKIIKGLTEKGYLISTSTDYISIKGVIKTTTKWVLSDKSMSIIKGLNSKQSKDKAKANNKTSLPTQAYQATTKEAKEATKETAPQKEYKPSLAELRRNYPIAD